MTVLNNLTDVYLICLFILPGLIIIYVRSRFVSGKRPSHTENGLAYFALSIVYYALALPFLPWAITAQAPWTARATIWICLSLIGPAVFGLILGTWTQKEFGGRFASKLGLNLIHVIPTAWDWRFSKVPPGGMYVMVTLTNGESVAGYFGPNSFASSDTAERDMYVEEEYTISDTGNWESRPSKVGILIPVKEIRYIEFWEPS